MKTYTTYSILFGLFFLGFSLQQGLAQTFTLDNSQSTMKVEGTSNLHDWEIDVEALRGTLEVEQNGESITFKKLSLKIEAESLKSGKRAMDKNTFKALDTDEHQYLTYTLKKVLDVQQTSASTYTVKTSGSLSIAGTTQTVTIPFEMQVEKQSVSLKGAHDLQMTVYNIEPPTALFGTITTGDTVKINFETPFINQTL